jgi:hypothetical protein
MRKVAEIDKVDILVRNAENEVSVDSASRKMKANLKSGETNWIQMLLKTEARSPRRSFPLPELFIPFVGGKFSAILSSAGH